jgi:hypothetical protein
VSVAFRNRNAQRGIGLILLLVVVVLAFTYVLMSRLPLATHQTAAKREHNAKVLNQAKQALIGWMVINAAQTDNNPGRLPCPEGVNNIATAQEGVAAPDPGDPTCARVGRLPWRTLGLDKLADADAEPLWYAVSPGWALQNTSSLLTINSDKRGQMTVDGVAAPNDVIALIIAPGRAMNVQAAPGCTARNQARAAPAPTMNPADYVECFNAATPAFSTVGPAASFNDQVLAVTTADLIPELEAAIQQRMQREIAPALKTVYASAAWGQTAANPVYPFAAQFALPPPDPGPGPGPGNSYQGVDGGYKGLLPFNCSATGCASDSRYSPAFVNWTTSGGGPSISVSGPGLVSGGGSCTLTGNQINCNGSYVAVGTVTFTITVRAINVAMALRRLDPSGVTLTTGSLLSLGTCSSPGTVTSISGSFRSDGGADMTMKAQASGLLGPPPGLLPLSVTYCMTAQLGMFADDPLLDSSNPTTGWFVRNEWYRLVWYQVAPKNTVDNLTGGVPVGCVNPTPPPPAPDCLGINGTRNIRALMVLMGRSLSNPPANRPNGDLMDYLEHNNCDRTLVGGVFVCNPGATFEQRPMRTDKVVSGPAFAPPNNTPFYAPFNDRIVLVDWIAPTPTFPMATLLP